jgi:hypothetical protein
MPRYRLYYDDGTTELISGYSDEDAFVSRFDEDDEDDMAKAESVKHISTGDGYEYRFLYGKWWHNSEEIPTPRPREPEPKLSPKATIAKALYDFFF